MARRVRSKDLETRTARLRLARRKKPYAVKIMRGVYLLYRRNETAGPWMVRVCRGGEDWTERLGLSDDFDEADARDTLDYWQAQDRAPVQARVGKPTSDLSVRAAVERYERDLEARGNDSENARRVLSHLASSKLANKLLTAPSLANNLSEFRDHLVAQGCKPATIDRIFHAFRAALNLAAENDERITRRPWKAALKDSGGAEAGAGNVILDDADRRALRGVAYRDSDEFGLLIDVLDETGARPSQVARLTAEDVQADFTDPRTGKRQPRLMIPVSRKGNGKKKARSIPVPITGELADRLKGRTGVLLRRADGTPWVEVNLTHYCARAMEGVTFNNPSKVTMYALRHTSIVRQLLAGVPTRVVAALHDTSVVMIEHNYSRFIGDHVDDIVRATLPRPAEIVPLGDRRVTGA
jgi:integrase